LIGGVLGTFLIPVPILGTLIGAVVGAMGVEFVRFGELQIALDAGGHAFRLYLLSVTVEFASSLLIIAVFALSVWA
jgi:uncharacterized protein YqgC (DUF456 family)